MEGIRTMQELKFFREQIRVITPEQGTLLLDNRLPSELRSRTGLYLAKEGDSFVAFDYSDAERNIQAWELWNAPRRFVYSMENDSEGWVEGFPDIVDAIHYLMGMSPDDIEKDKEELTVLRRFKRWRLRRRLERVFALDHRMRERPLSQRGLPQNTIFKFLEGSIAQWRR